MNKYSFRERQLSGVNAMPFASEKLQIVTRGLLKFSGQYFSGGISSGRAQVAVCVRSCTLP